MQPQLRHADARRVAGLALRTDNAAEARGPAGGGRIPGLWQRFRSENWFERLEELGAVGPPIGVYSSYESDLHGSFQILAGREVAGSPIVAAPIEVVSLPAGKYLVFQSTGPLPGSVVKGWQEVWAYFERSHEMKRAYTHDFEVYPNDQTVAIWIAVLDG